MTTIRLTLALLLFMTVGALAQIPRTINYQGRVKDAAGLIEGQRSITVGIYDRATGGAPLFSETQQTQFTGGIYTLVIGGGTPGGIPAAVDFSERYWLGVTIQGFNGGQEITPRLQFHSSATSIRSAVADSAVTAATAIIADSSRVARGAVNADRAAVAKFADSTRVADTANVAVSIELPGLLAAQSSTDPVLRVTNLQQKTGVGLLAQGERYAIISTGIDSTREHYVAGANAGTSAVPAVGGFYRDNAPIAWAVIDADGTIISDFGLSRVAHQTGRYELQLDNPVQLTGTAAIPAMAPMVTVEGDQGGALVFAHWTFKKDGTGAGFDPSTLIVTIRNLESLPADRRFSIVVFGRP